MTPEIALNRCMQTLRVIIRTADANGIGLAEKAVDEFVENIPGDDNARDGQLGVLTNQVLAVKVADNSPALEVVFNIETYITNKRNALRDNL